MHRLGTDITKKARQKSAVLLFGTSANSQKGLNSKKIGKMNRASQGNKPYEQLYYII